MRSLVSLFVLSAAISSGAVLSYHVVGDDPGPWTPILSSVGFRPDAIGPAGIVVIRGASDIPAAQWIERANKGAFIVLEGGTPLSEELGFHATSRKIAVRSVQDARSPKLPIIWERALELPLYEVPAAARVFVRERWTGAPLIAGMRQGSGAILWMAVTPGTQGYERFPYLLQALCDLGLEAPYRSSRLWAFFDSSYRSRVDLDYFAERWRKSGISAIHVAAWHYYEPNAENDAYLKKLIEACHRRSISVYAWIELPHVSEKFWADHPEWREKTALQQDAQLDWRKLINLTNRDAFASVSHGVKDLIGRFDWDGVNLAELYFESLEGYANPARFTPMNADVRESFKKTGGFDPIELFQAGSPRNPAKDATGMRSFLEFRAELARRQQTEWMEVIESARKNKSMDLVLTHIDDRFDTRMHDLLGADTAKTLPLLEQHDFTFLIEDPATIWNLGPQRYTQIANRYQPLTPATGKLAIDINIVDRYQDVYPTKQQTGLELFELVHQASAAFPRVALYFENSLLNADLPLLASAGAVVDRVERMGNKLVIESKHGVGLPWKGPAMVDGRAWPIRAEGILWLPAGTHSVEAAVKDVPLRLLDFNGTLQAANTAPNGVEFAYQSNARAMALMERAVKSVEIDGAMVTPDVIGNVLLLPRGQHLVRVIAQDERK